MKNDVRKILEENLYLSLSTVDEDANPWISNAYYAFDDKLNLYWYSGKKTKHSINLQKNNRVAICIFNSTLVGDDVSALYLTGTVTEINELKKLIKSLKIYAKRMANTNFIHSKKQLSSFIKSYFDFEKSSPLRMYMFKPERVWILGKSIDYNGKYIDSRVEISLIKQKPG